MFTKTLAKFRIRTMYDLAHMVYRDDYREIYISLCEDVIADYLTPNGVNDLLQREV